MPKELLNKEYTWEELYDLERDAGEVLDSPQLSNLDPEFKGIIRVKIEYISEDDLYIEEATDQKLGIHNICWELDNDGDLPCTRPKGHSGEHCAVNLSSLKIAKKWS